MTSYRFDGFEVKHYMCVGAKFRTEVTLYLSGMFMGFSKRHLTWQTKVHLDGNAVAYAASAQMVYVTDMFVLGYDAEYTLFCFVRKTLLKKFAS